MLNGAIQALLLACALLINFIIPAIYGLEFYGEFIQTNILVFLFHKIADITTEPLIARVKNVAIFPLALALSLLIWAIFFIANFFINIGSTSLLAAMLLASCTMLSMHALGLRKVLICYLLTFLLTFLALLGAKEFLGSDISIEEILYWTNLVPALGASAAIIKSGIWTPTTRDIAGMLTALARITPLNISASLLFNLLTNLLPYILSKTLPPRELALFRIATTIIQSATSVFPINVKTIFADLVNNQNRNLRIRALLTWSFLYFSSIGTIALASALIKKELAPYLVIITSLPTLHLAVMLDRYTQASKKRRQLVIANITISILIATWALQVRTFESAILCYSAAIAIYATWLATLLDNQYYIYRLLPIIIPPPIISMLQEDGFIYAFIYFFCALLYSATAFKPKLTELAYLKSQP